MALRYFFLVLFSSLFFWVGAQNDGDFVSGDSLRIGEIRFVGNKKTRRSYLLKELDLSKYNNYPIHIIEARVQALNSLNGLYKSRVQEYNRSSDNTTDLVIEVYEQKTLLPIANLGLISNNNWFQLGGIDINLAGVGDELLAYYQYGEQRHSGQIYYKNNSLWGSNYGIHFNVLRWNSLEPLNFDESRLEYDYLNQLVGSGLHYNFNSRHSLEYSGSFFQERYERIMSGNNLPGPSKLTLNKLLNKLEHVYTTFSYEDINIEGLFVRSRLQNVLTFATSELFYIGEMEVKWFSKPTDKTNVGVRINMGLANNYDSPFSPFTIDSYSNVRGAGNRVLRGTAILSGNFEYRRMLYSQMNWACQAVAFIDVAYIREPGESIDQSFHNNQNRNGIGIGTRLIYKRIYNAVIRIDIAYETYTKEPALVVGLGQYF